MKIHQERVPINEDTKNIIAKAPSSESEDLIREAMQEVLHEYGALPSKIQEDILEDIKSKKKEGLKFKEISDRLNILITKGKELDGMTSEDSDLVYKPKPSLEDLKLADEEGDMVDSEEIEKLIKKLEDMMGKDKEDEGDNTEDEPKDWIN